MDIFTRRQYTVFCGKEVVNRMTDSSPAKVLIVDDVESSVDELVSALGDLYDVRVAMDGPAALEAAAGDRPDLILLDIIMPDMDGYQVCERLAAAPETAGIPVIFLTSKTEESDEARGLAMGAVDYITKPFSLELVKARVKNHLNLKRYRDHLEDLVRERTREISALQEVMINSLSALAETRDLETGGHILRTQRYVRVLAEALKGHPKFRSYLSRDGIIDLLFKTAPLHDIGKVGVPDLILKKPGKLTPLEFEEMKQHTAYGVSALRSAEESIGGNAFLQVAAEIAMTHHEKWDGRGYPKGLAGEGIPISGRLMALADVYDALISRRVYKSPYSHKKAVDIITNEREKSFDPDVVDAFLANEQEFRTIAYHYLDSYGERLTLGA